MLFVTNWPNSSVPNRTSLLMKTTGNRSLTKFIVTPALNAIVIDSTGQLKTGRNFARIFKRGDIGLAKLIIPPTFDPRITQSASMIVPNRYLLWIGNSRNR